MNDLFNQIEQRKYVEIWIGKNSNYLVNSYISSGYLYDIMPHFFKAYKNREMRLLVTGTNFQALAIPLSSYQRLIVDYDMLSYVN